MGSPAAPGAPQPARPTTTFFEAVGGEATFRALVDRFYATVEHDPVLRPLYPEPDLRGASNRLRMFLVQYWGGPNDYQQQRGHPRLRMRHAPFHVGPAARDAWLSHMRAALDSLHLPAAQAATLWDYLEGAAFALQNQPDDLA